MRMDNLARQRIGRFDQVQLLTTKNVSYLSAPAGTDIKPYGIWSVAAVFEESGDLLCTRKGTTIKIPAKDVLKRAGYDVSEITKQFGKLSNGES